MAWETCQYCQMKINGYYKLRDHKRDNHPGKLELEEAQQMVQAKERALARTQERKAIYEFLNAALRDGQVPEPAINYFARERDNQVYRHFSDTGPSTATEAFARKLEEDQEQLAKAQAELAAMEEAEAAHA